MRRPSPRPAAVLLAALAATACSLNPNSTAPREVQGRVITAEQIERSGAQNAWEALRRTGAHISMDEDRRGEPTGMRKRGAGSIVLSTTPVIVIDGVHVVDFRSLRNVHAQTIAEIRILSGAEGTARYGTGAANGVIVISTKTGV